MSFLLDALGKADHDRRRSEVPELRTYEQRGGSSLRSILRGVLIISLLLLSFAAGYVLRPVLENAVFGGILLARAPVEEQGIDTPAGVGAASEPDPVAPLASDTIRMPGAIPVLEVISYSETPSARFAMINGAVVYEGEVLATGERVLEIEANAVLLDRSGEQIRVGL